jgi:hypothetical protein
MLWASEFPVLSIEAKNMKERKRWDIVCPEQPEELFEYIYSQKLSGDLMRRREILECEITQACNNSA